LTGAVAVSAPGKLILMGEHAVVYGRPALVSAIDLRLTARFSPLREAGAAGAAGGGGLRLALPGLGCEAETSWAEARAYARRARERWEGYAASPAPEAFRALRGEDPIHLVKVALGEAAEAAGRLGIDGGPAAALRVDSELPLGSGFGSSAAAAAAVVAGALDLLGAPADLAAVESLVHEVERRQHGTPSGVDAATVIEELMTRYIEALVYQAVAENMASEQSARMVAMKAATDNAGKLISELQLVYNKARQAAITKELSEIVGGAAAV